MNINGQIQSEHVFTLFKKNTKKKEQKFYLIILNVIFETTLTKIRIDKTKNNTIIPIYLHINLTSTKRNNQLTHSLQF